MLDVVLPFFDHLLWQIGGMSLAACLPLSPLRALPHHCLRSWLRGWLPPDVAAARDSNRFTVSSTAFCGSTSCAGFLQLFAVGTVLAIYFPGTSWKRGVSICPGISCCACLWIALRVHSEQDNDEWPIVVSEMVNLTVINT